MKKRTYRNARRGVSGAVVPGRGVMRRRRRLATGCRCAKLRAKDGVDHLSRRRVHPLTPAGWFLLLLRRRAFGHRRTTRQILGRRLLGRLRDEWRKVILHDRVPVFGGRMCLRRSRLADHVHQRFGGRTLGWAGSASLAGKATAADCCPRSSLFSFERVLCAQGEWRAMGCYKLRAGRTFLCFFSFFSGSVEAISAGQAARAAPAVRALCGAL